MGGGEMGALIRSIDWSKSPLGPPETWPQSLKTCVRIVLTSRQPMFVWWGEQLINIYNDAYLDIVRGKHPGSFGAPAREVWREIWDQVGPRAETALRTNEGTYDESLLLIMERNGYPEETYYTFSYSPVPGDAGGTEGIICANTDDTQRIIGERQLRTLKDLGKALADISKEKEVYEKTIQVLQDNPQDFPFAFLYQLQPDEKTLLLKSKSRGIDTAVIPTILELNSAIETPWHLNKAIQSNKIEIAENLKDHFGSLPSGAWEKIPDRALVIPIEHSGQKMPFGVLVVGLNPYRLLDEKYQSFFQLLADQIATSLSNIHIYEEERKRAEALAELDQAKTTFFSNVSHEFRTPLTLMLGPMEDMLNGQHHLPFEDRENLQTAHRNALRLLKLVNTLLDFSRIESNRIQASYQPVDLCELTEDLASNFRSAIEKAGMQLVLDCRTLSEPVYVDREMWEKIILNLLSNAFKYTLEGSIEVGLKEENRQAVVWVRDTGVGIPDSEMENIFKRFHRVQNVQGRTHEGTGIGLSLVQELVHLHQGKIQVKSKTGKGSTFTVSIPMGKAHLPHDRIVSPKKMADLSSNTNPYLEEAIRWLPKTNDPLPTFQSSPKTSKRPYILLADDNADMRNYVTKLLSPQYEIITVNDGLEALEKVREKAPDLILSDIMMPRMDGLELLKNLKRDPKTAFIPVILLSARAGEEAKIDGLEAGADDYLIKPFSAKELIARVNTHIKIAALRLESERQMRNIVLQAPFSIIILRGPDFIYEIANDAYLSLAQKTYEEVIGKPLFEVFPEIEDQGMRALLEKMVTTGESFSLNEQPLTLYRNGKTETVYYNSVYQPLRDMEGRISSVLLMGIEVTEQVLARKKVEESERRYHHLIANSPAAIAILKGPEMVITTANDAILTTWGKGRDIIGKPLLEIMPEVVEQGFGDLLQYVFTTGNSYYAHESKVILERNGNWEEVYYSFVYQPYYEDGDEICGVVIIANEVTPQAIVNKKIEESEQQLRNMIIQAPVGIAILRGSDYIFEIINKDYEQLVNKSHDDLINKPLLEALPELQTQPIKDLLDMVVSTGEPFFGDEYPVILNRFGKAETVYFNFVYQPLREANGKISGVMAVANEVTEQVNARIKVEESEARYRSLFETMDQGFCVCEMLLDENGKPNDYRFLEVNPTFEQQTGLKDAVGKTARELVPNLEDHWFKTYGKVALTGESVRFLDGSEAMNRWFEVYAYRIGGTESLKFGLLFSDISERKNTEEALRKSHQFNQDVLDSLPEHIAVLDKNGNITAINEAWRRFAIENGADWTMKGVGVGTNYLEVCRVEDGSPEATDARAIYQGLKEVLNEPDKFFSLEYPCHSPTKKRWFLLTVSPLTHGEGGAVVSHLNITSRRLVEEALRENAERLRIATESAELGTWDYNPISGELLWDDRTKALFGLSPNATVTYDVFLEGLHPDDRQYTDETVRRTLAGKNKGVYDIEYRTIGIEDHKLHWLRAKGKAFFDGNKKAIRFTGTVVDITKAKLYERGLQESEELFRKLADNVPVKIWITRPDGYCTYLNKQWYNYTGQKPGEALGFGWMTIIHPDDIKTVEAIFFDANEKHIPFSFEYRLLGKEGNYRWKMQGGSPRLDENGAFEGFIGVIVDIHERKIAEDQKDAFMRIAGHELRTPLTSLVGYLSLMLKASHNTEMVTKFAKKSYDSALKMRGLITDFLDFSRAQQGEISYNISEFDFDTLVKEIVENMQISYPQHRILRQGKTEKRMQGDYGRIEQILTNLLHNAIKYSPGKDRIDVMLESTPNTIILKVKDYGMGIEAKDLDKIFSKFQRAGNTGKIKGMGLGLYIAQEIVHFHKGKIGVESTPGKGALFTVELPAI